MWFEPERGDHRRRPCSLPGLHGCTAGLRMSGDIGHEDQTISLCIHVRLAEDSHCDAGSVAVNDPSNDDGKCPYHGSNTNPQEHPTTSSHSLWRSYKRANSVEPTASL